MTRLCYSCMPTTIVEDDVALACPREYCAARSDLERETKPQGTRPPQLNPGEVYTIRGGNGSDLTITGNGGPHYYDDGGGA